MIYCELCGCEIVGRAVPIVVENVSMQVCPSCSRHGRMHVAKKRESREETKFTFKVSSVAENYSNMIRGARKKMGLTQGELGRRIGEPGSVVDLMEQGKFKPGEELARKIEQALAISLLKEETA